MTGAKLIRLQGTVSTRSEASGHLKSPGDSVLIERGRPRWVLLSCPCGCGEDFPINLDPRAGPAWTLYGNPPRGLRLFPSRWGGTGRSGQFSIWRVTVSLFGRYDARSGP